MGKLLIIDLTKRKVDVERLNAEVLRKYIGGSGLGARLLYDGTDERTDPLGPENLLIFMTGPLTGTKVPTSGRHAVVTRSPLTGIWGESDVGGTWGIALKRAGYDGVVIRGAADRPVYVIITEEEVRVADASHLWGMDTYQLDEVLRREVGPEGVISSIGPAGEKLVRFASIMSDGRAGRAAGRTGVGAVMGSKKLKALVTLGKKEIVVADPVRLERLNKAIVPGIVKGTRERGLYGTAAWVVTAEHLGDLPLKNWVGSTWEEGAEKLSGQTMAKTILKRRYYCGSCVIGCGREVEVQDGPYAGVLGAGPEYETIGMLGGLTLVDNLEAIALGHQMCNQYGLDVISTGAVIAFAMECFEHGLITTADTGGIELRWGSASAMLEIIRQIGERQELGALLGEGVRRAADEIGGLAREFAIHCKGLEFPAHDPRAMKSLAVSYATSNRGACHLQSLAYPVELKLAIPELGYPEPLDRFTDEGKGVLTARMQDLMSLIDSLKVCKFIVTGGGGVQPSHLVDWLNAVTGWDMDLTEFLKTGERLSNLKRQYSVRLGISRKDDVLPPRILTTPRLEGGARESLPHLGLMLREYYAYRGWDEQGRPTPQKLAELGL